MPDRAAAEARATPEVPSCRSSPETAPTGPFEERLARWLADVAANGRGPRREHRCRTTPSTSGAATSGRMRHRSPTRRRSRWRGRSCPRARRPRSSPTPAATGRVPRPSGTATRSCSPSCAPAASTASPSTTCRGSTATPRTCSRSGPSSSGAKWRSSWRTMPATRFDGATGRFLFGQLALAAQLQRDLDSERMASQCRAIFEAGGHRGLDPFGYRTVPDVRPRTLELVEAEADGRPTHLGGAGARAPPTRSRSG